MEKREWIEAVEFLITQVNEDSIDAIDLHKRLNGLTTMACYNLSSWSRKSKVKSSV